MITAEKSRFYCPEERKLHGNGNKYDLTIDNIIIQTLYTNKSLSYGKLKSTVEEKHDKSHIRSCSDRIKNLVDHGILSRVDHGRGKAVEYSLTEDAIKQVRLNLIGVSIDTSMLFRKIYQTILFNDISEHLPVRVESEEDLDKIILAELHVNKSELIWSRTATGDNVDSVDIIYPTASMDDLQTVIRNYWKERKGESTVLENVEFICYPLAYNRNLDVIRFLLKRIPLAHKRNLDVILKRIEYWQINKYSENKKYHQEYLCELPGFSVEELLASKRFNNDDVNFAFTAVRDLKLIGRSMEFQGKTRFIISDGALHELLIHLWTIHEAEFLYQVEKWKHFDAPTSEEKNRIINLMGEQEAARFFKQLDLARSQHNLDLRKFGTAEEYNEYIKKECSDFLEILAIDSELDFYKEKERGNKKLVTNKELKDDLHKFVNFRKKDLNRCLKYLPVTYNREGIEELKMEFKDTLEKYTYFQPVLKEICPNVFETNDDSE